MELKKYTQIQLISIMSFSGMVMNICLEIDNEYSLWIKKGKDSCAKANSIWQLNTDNSLGLEQMRI